MHVISTVAMRCHVAAEDPEAAQSAPADSDENIAGKQPATAPSKPAQQTRGSPGVTKSVELNSLRQIPHVGVTATPAHGSPRLEGQRAPVRREETDLSDEQLEETLLPSTAGEGRETSDSLAFGNGDVQKDAQVQHKFCLLHSQLHTWRLAVHIMQLAGSAATLPFSGCNSKALPWPPAANDCAWI